MLILVLFRISYINIAHMDDLIGTIVVVRDKSDDIFNKVFLNDLSKVTNAFYFAAIKSQYSTRYQHELYKIKGVKLS